ncbi:MAG: response regulator [Patescibacteria group bacterium]
MNNKILIIENDANLLAGLQAKFSVEGFSVHIDIGNNKDDCLKKVAQFQPNYIILDLILPCLDYFTLLTDLKSNQQASDILVFIYSNLSDEDTRARCKNLGVDYCLVKIEFSLDDFVTKIKKIIANRRKLGS